LGDQKKGEKEVFERRASLSMVCLCPRRSHASQSSPVIQVDSTQPRCFTSASSLSRAVVTLASAPGGATSRRRADAPTSPRLRHGCALQTDPPAQSTGTALCTAVLYYTVITLHIAAYQGIQLRVYFTNLSSFNMPLQHTPEHKMAMPRCVLASGIALPRQI
jgi:hypothetical protein